MNTHKFGRKILSLCVALLLLVTPSMVACAEDFEDLGSVGSGEYVILSAVGNSSSSTGSGSTDHELTEEEIQAANNHSIFQNVQGYINQLISYEVEGTKKVMKQGEVIVSYSTLKVPNANIDRITDWLSNVSYTGTGAYNPEWLYLQNHSGFSDLDAVGRDADSEVQAQAFEQLYGYDGFLTLPNMTPIKIPSMDEIMSLIEQYGYDYIKVPTGSTIINGGIVDVPTIEQRQEIIKKLLTLNSINDKMELIHVQEVKSTSVNRQERFVTDARSSFIFNIGGPNGKTYRTGIVNEAYWRFMSNIPGLYQASCKQNQTYYTADSVTYATQDYIVDAKTGFLIWSWSDSVKKQVNPSSVSTGWVNLKNFKFTITPGQISQWQGQPYMGSKTERRK